MLKDIVEKLNEVDLSPLQKEYRAYFTDKLKEFGVKTPAELPEKEKIKFFNDISAGWENGVGEK